MCIFVNEATRSSFLASPLRKIPLQHVSNRDVKKVFFDKHFREQVQWDGYDKVSVIDESHLF